MSYKYKDTNGTIHDVANNYEFAQPGYEKYSTTEELCGEWIDGKPIYRKVIQFTLPSSAASLNVNMGISDLKKVVNLYGNFSNAAGTAVNPIPQYIVASGSITNSVRMYVSSLTTITVEMVGTTYASRSGMVVIEYTKTTD